MPYEKGLLQKRLLRLQNYFAPYPQFLVRLSENQDSPLSLRKAPADGCQHLLIVDRSFLGNAPPEWTESSILECALLWSREKGKMLSDNLFFLKLLDVFRKMFPRAQTSFLEQIPASNKKNQKVRRRRSQNTLTAESISDIRQPTSCEELLCSEKLLITRWHALREYYFPDIPELEQFSIHWSERRQKHTLGSCSIRKKRVQIATVMRHVDALPYLDALIYHEMCHAALGEPKIINGRRSIHGPDFKALEKRHPDIKKLDAWIKAGGWRSTVRKHRRKRSL